MSISPIPLAVRRARLLKEVTPFRPVAVQLLNLVSDINQPLARVVSLLRTNAVLVAEVLRLVNSPLLGCRCEIKNILQALAMLGTERVTSLIITTALRGLAAGANSTLARACWRHNLASAVICERIAPPLHMNTERAYMAGLVHDIGRLALIRAFPDYEQAMNQAGAQGRSLSAAESSLYGMDHAEAGRWLLSKWGCPLEFQNVAALHENPSAAAGRDWELVCLVGAASQLADLMNFSDFPETHKKELPEIVELVPGAASQLVDFATLAEFVATRVNSIELSLG